MASITTPILEIKKRIGDVQLKFNAIFNAEDEHYIKLRRIAITGDCELLTIEALNIRSRHCQMLFPKKKSS